MITVYDVLALILAVLGMAGALRFVRADGLRVIGIVIVAVATVSIAPLLPIQAAILVLAVLGCTLSASSRAMAQVRYLYGC